MKIQRKHTNANKNDQNSMKNSIFFTQILRIFLLKNVNFWPHSQSRLLIQTNHPSADKKSPKFMEKFLLVLNFNVLFFKNSVFKSSFTNTTTDSNEAPENGLK